MAQLEQSGELRRTVPKIIGFCLSPEGCSYRMALVRIKKACPGHALRVMVGVWSHLRPFMFMCYPSSPWWWTKTWTCAIGKKWSGS